MRFFFRRPPRGQRFGGSVISCVFVRTQTDTDTDIDTDTDTDTLTHTRIQNLFCFKLDAKSVPEALATTFLIM